MCMYVCVRMYEYTCIISFSICLSFSIRNQYPSTPIYKKIYVFLILFCSFLPPTLIPDPGAAAGEPLKLRGGGTERTPPPQLQPSCRRAPGAIWWPRGRSAATRRWGPEERGAKGGGTVFKYKSKPSVTGNPEKVARDINRGYNCGDKRGCSCKYSLSFLI